MEEWLCGMEDVCQFHQGKHRPTAAIGNSPSSSCTTPPCILPQWCTQPEKWYTTAISFASCSSVVTCATGASIFSHQKLGKDGSGHTIQPAARSPVDVLSYDISVFRRLDDLVLQTWEHPSIQPAVDFIPGFEGGGGKHCVVVPARCMKRFRYL